MARLTLEDCMHNVRNRYDLVLLAAKRARGLSAGREALLDVENDKPTVVALREIARGLITQENIDAIDSPPDEQALTADSEALFPPPVATDTDTDMDANTDANTDTDDAEQETSEPEEGEQEQVETH